MRLLTSSLLIAVCWAAWPAAVQAEPADAAFIRGLYKEYLGRSGSAQEVRTWMRLAERKDLSRRDLRAYFMASEEFFDRHARDRSRTIRAMYKHVVGRAPSRGEVDTWLEEWRAYYEEDRFALVRALQDAARNDRPRR